MLHYSCKHVLDKSNSSFLTFATSTWTIIWFQFFTAPLSASKDFFAFFSKGMPHTFRPRKDIVSVPLPLKANGTAKIYQL